MKTEFDDVYVKLPNLHVRRRKKIKSSKHGSQLLDGTNLKTINGKLFMPKNNFKSLKKLFGGLR